MGFSLSVLVAVTSFLTAPVSSLAIHDANPWRDASRLQTLVFTAPISSFVALSRQHLQMDNWFDWSTDLCSAPFVGNSGHTFDFSEPCLRHDFAYRNFKLMDTRYSCVRRVVGQICSLGTSQFGRWWNSSIRFRIDNQFKKDMDTHCTHRLLGQRWSCQAWATIFYKAVRIVGGP